MPKITQQQDLIEVLKKLEGYEGYVQFSHEKFKIIDPTQIELPEKKDAFLVEAHYYSKAEQKSAIIRYHAGAWYQDNVELKNIQEQDSHTYVSKANINVRQSQVWVEEEDECCLNWKVKKLKKVVFAGFAESQTGGER
jgi:CRISPR type III-associated protein (TIGR04423 family)